MLQANSLRMQSVICTFRLDSLACSRRSDSRARGSVGSELNCTPGKRGRGSEGGEDESPPPYPPLVSPRFSFLREFLSRSLLSERLEHAMYSFTRTGIES